MLDRMIRDDRKRVAAIFDHDLRAVEMYDVHHTRLARWCFRKSLWFGEKGQKLLGRI